MYVLPDRTLGIVIVALFALQGVFIVFSKGSLRFQRPRGGAVAWAYNVLNLSVILLLSPLAGFSLLKGWPTLLAWSQPVTLPAPAAAVVGGLGLACYVAGNLLMYWTRVIMGGSFRLGAVPPGADDELVVRGPFAVVRHPMYSAVLLLALGLGLALYSVLFLAAFLLLLPLIVTMIPTEEAQLVASYGDDYAAYQRRTKRLLPFVY